MKKRVKKKAKKQVNSVRKAKQDRLSKELDDLRGAVSDRFNRLEKDIQTVCNALRTHLNETPELGIGSAK